MLTNLFLIFTFVGAAGSALFIMLTLKNSAPKQDYRSLMGSSSGDAAMTQTGINRVSQLGKKEVDNEKLEELKKQFSKGKRKKGEKGTIEAQFMRAGIFSKKDQENYKKAGPMLAVGGAVFFLLVGSLLTTMDLAIAASVLGGIVGTRVPSMWLDKKEKARSEEILYYLPLVIEQIAIGVSSSLDIGPCLGMVVKMADERGSHNVVTELIKHVQFYVKSGASLEEALEEVGTASGHTELGHSFSSLAQVAKHGGEISKQMQDLADSVSSQRETKVEERIKTLELKATGPVALVFVGFMIVLIAGFFIQIKKGMAQ